EDNDSEANKIIDEVIQISEKYGLLKILELALYTKGVLYTKSDNHKLAKPLFYRSYELAKSLKITNRILYCFGATCRAIAGETDVYDSIIFYKNEILEVRSISGKKNFHISNIPGFENIPGIKSV
ncbi:MAG: hypothetical protein ACJ748_01240, partial [Flavisolibacter sp.]